MRWRASVAALGLAIRLLAVSPGHAADIAVDVVDGVNIVTIAGQLEEPDSDRFDRMVARLDGKIIVDLNSPGGLLIPGLSIGETIRRGGYSTVVRSRRACASACGLIWLSGTHRFLGSSGRVGFHAAYTGTGDDAREVGAGNALVGAYLNKLGLSMKAVYYATSAGPGEMKWLTMSDARSVGIEYAVIPDPEPKPAPTPAETPVAGNSPAERQALRLVGLYYGVWSHDGADVEGLSRFYGTTAQFYGAVTSRDAIMQEKRKFSARWTSRKYTIKPATLFVQCADVCAVSGVLDWDVNSAERNARSTGTANFVLKIALTNSEAGGVILSENGSVLSSRSDTLSPPAAQSTLSSPASLPPPRATASQGYADGRQARIVYESWYSNLIEGPYKDGVDFWATNRSGRTLPSCLANPSGPWQQGCLAAQNLLGGSDARRKGEPDFRVGWNSL